MLANLISVPFLYVLAHIGNCPSKRLWRYNSQMLTQEKRFNYRPNLRESIMVRTEELHIYQVKTCQERFHQLVTWIWNSLTRPLKTQIFLQTWETFKWLSILTVFEQPSALRENIRETWDNQILTCSQTLETIKFLRSYRQIRPLTVVASHMT